MSAICGIIHFDDRPVDLGHLNAMICASATRGPDGVRKIDAKNAAFAHLAFHVTPESVYEQQPVVSSNSNLILIADARIDNRTDLIQELNLQPNAVSPHPRTDPELILRAWQRWGTDCPNHLLGDFVFAIWDKQTRQLFLARDPLGSYSVSWYKKDNRFFFASETAAILDLPDVNPEINALTVTRQLAFTPPDAEETFFQSIRYLAPGHTLLVTRDTIEKKRYWKVNPNHQIRYKSSAEYVDHFLEILNDAVACRLRSIGPVGIALSGGNDSTLIAACAAKLLPTINPDHPRLQSYSYVFDQHKSCDERQYINPVVAQYGIDAHFINGDDKWTFGNLHTQPIARDFFWANPYSQLPLSLSLEAEKHQCRVMLNGHFGDDLFSGSSTYAADLLYRGRLIKLLQLLSEEQSAADAYQSLITYGVRPLVPRVLRNWYRKLSPSRRWPLIPGINKQRLAELRRSQRDWQPHHKACEQLTPSKRLMCNSLFGEANAIGLHAVRAKVFNLHGMEQSSPYYDRRLIEYLLAIPSEEVSRTSQPRRLQRAAMNRLLPSIVSNRHDKTRYTSLFQEGIYNKETSTVRKLLNNPRCVQEKWITAESINLILTEPKTDEIEMLTMSTYLHLELWLNAIQEALAGNMSWSTPYFYKETDSFDGSSE